MTVQIIYFSGITENTHTFVQKLGWETATRIPVKGEITETVSQPFVLIVPSYGTIKTGHVPPQVKKFLNNPNNAKLCVGVIGSGNINFAEEYTMAADVISRRFNIPVLYRFELAGTSIDVEQVKKGLVENETQLLQILESKPVTN